MNVNLSVDDQPITVWVIEDNDTYRNSIVALVGNTEGMRCAHAFQCCEKALKALEDDFAPEIILMDIGLPGMSGIEGLGRIKAISPSTNLIMLTVFDDEKQILVFRVLDDDTFPTIRTDSLAGLATELSTDCFTVPVK